MPDRDDDFDDNAGFNQSQGGAEKQTAKPESEQIVVSVKNPTVMKDGALSKNYIIYDVEGKDKEGEFKVKRRFKDFFELRTKLVETWPGVMIPPLPEKKLKVFYS